MHFKEFRTYRSRVILAAYKGVLMVELDSIGPTVTKFPLENFGSRPANNRKSKVISMLKTIKADEGLGNNTYKRPYPI